MMILLPLAGDQVHRVRAGLFNEAEEDFSRNRHTGFVVVPGSCGQIEAAGKLRSAMIAKEILADFSQTTR